MLLDFQHNFAFPLINFALKQLRKAVKQLFYFCIINIKIVFNKLYAKIQFFISKFIAFQLMRVYNKLKQPITPCTFLFRAPPIVTIQSVFYKLLRIMK